MHTIEQVNKNIERVRTLSGDFDEAVQAAAIGVLTHLITHGNIGVVNKLLNAMEGSAKGKRSRLKKWMVAHGCVSLVHKDPAKAVSDTKGTPALDKIKRLDILAKYDGDVEKYFVALLDAPAWHFVPKVDKPVEFKLYTQITDLLTSFEKKLAKLEAGEVEASQEEMQAIKEQALLMTYIREAKAKWVRDCELADEQEPAQAAG